MFGERLGVNVHLVTAGEGPLANLETCVDALPPRRRRACVVALRLGARRPGRGRDGPRRHRGRHGRRHDHHRGLLRRRAASTSTRSRSAAMHVTNDIARGLRRRPSMAERLKTLYGSAIGCSRRRPRDHRRAADRRERGAGVNQVPRSMLISIIRPRIEETFEMVRARLAAVGFDKLAGRRVVLTGGASSAPRRARPGGQILGKQVRVGQSALAQGPCPGDGGPGLHHLRRSAALRGRASTTTWRWVSASGHGAMAACSARFGRLGQWLRENL